MFGWLDHLVAWLGGRSARGLRYATVAHDGLAWRQRRAPARVVAVGDLQGDLVALDAILRKRKLVDHDGNWRGGDAHLVLLGDLISGHADARLLVAFVRRLEQQADAAGGAVHALLGNHEALAAMGRIERWSQAERQGYRDQPVTGAPSARPGDAYRGDGELGHWLRARNAMLQLGDTLFVHAGIGPWFPKTDPGAVNATVRAWLAHWQGVAGAPPEATRWAAGAERMGRRSRDARGPLWLRAFKPLAHRQPFGPTELELGEWLDERGIARVVVGHAPTEDGRVLLEHPYYGGRVVLTDTRIADRELGRMSALEITADGLRARKIKAKHRDPWCRRREVALLRGAVAADRTRRRRRRALAATK